VRGIITMLTQHPNRYLGITVHFVSIHYSFP